MTAMVFFQIIAQEKIPVMFHLGTQRWREHLQLASIVFWTITTIVVTSWKRSG